jgi:molybdenum cofactor cytidylyltransferase
VTVVRGDAATLAELLAQEDVGLVIAPMADGGMGDSLAAGVAATADAGGWVVALADMPYIRPDTVASVVAALQAGAHIVAPTLNGRRGHPVGFSARFAPQLLALHGDEGARHLLRERQEDLVTFECDDPGIVLDVDRPAAHHKESFRRARRACAPATGRSRRRCPARRTGVAW